MDYGPIRPLQRFIGAFDQVFACLGEHLDGDIIGDPVAFDQLAHKIEIRLRSGRETHFDFLVAHLNQQFKHLMLPLRAHGVNQSLVAVPQVHRAPPRRLGDDFVGPGAVGKLHRDLVLERDIFVERHSRRGLCVVHEVRPFLFKRPPDVLSGTWASRVGGRQHELRNGGTARDYAVSLAPPRQLRRSIPARTTPA